MELISIDRLNWCNALAYCEHLDFAGHEDWRLPNVRELQSIADYGRAAQAIDSVVTPWEYFSSTTNVNNPGYVWIVGFHIGMVRNVNKRDSFNVRAVRIAP